MREVWSLAMKDLRLLTRDKGGSFFTFFFPVLYAVFFGFMFGGMSGGGGGGGPAATPIVVVDEDGAEGAAEFIEILRADDRLSISASDDRDSAIESVRKGEQAAVVIVPEGFSDASVFQGQAMRLEVGVDPSRAAEAGLIQGLLTAKAFERFQGMFLNADSALAQTRDAMSSIDDTMDPTQAAILRTFLGSLDQFLEQGPDTGLFAGAGDSDDTEASGAAGFNPVEIESVEIVATDEGERNAFVFTFPQGILWGVMGCAAGFGISLVTERNSGTLTRLRTAPMSSRRVLLGKGLACFLSTVSVAGFLLVVARVVFQVVPDSVPLLALALVSIGVCFVGVMMLLSTIGRTEASAGGIGWAIMVVFAMFGGGMVPQAFMAPWMLQIGNFSPVKWSIEAMEGAIWRGFSLGDMMVPCGVLIAIGVGGFMLGSKLFDYSEN